MEFPKVQQCPVCGKLDVTPFHVVAHSAKGRPKTIDAAERKARAKRAAHARQIRWQKMEAAATEAAQRLAAANPDSVTQEQLAAAVHPEKLKRTARKKGKIK